MRFTPEQLAVLSQLLDAALELPPESRHSWLDSLGELDAAVKGELRALLERHGRLEFSDFLGTLRKFDPPDAAANDNALVAGTVVGPYVLECEIGRGGMGVVWRARRADGLVKRPVALKLLRAGFYSSELLARFAQERDILAGLSHPNIARLYDAGFTAAGQPFLALELVEGLGLTGYCNQKSLDVPARLQLMLQVLTAVQYAHSHLVVHRDLKPSNILVTPDGQVRLLDFGIAKLLAGELEANPGLTQLGERLLTLHYASPEQIAGKPLTTATDIYSLGVVFYELLTDVRPYRLKDETSHTLEEAILNGAPVRPSRASGMEVGAERRATTARRLARLLRGDLDTIALKALSKDPEQRYASADAFAQDLVRFAQGKAVLAQPSSAWYRARKLIARNRLAAVSAVAVVLALTIGLGIALWQAHRAREHARAAETQAQIATAVQAFMLNLFHANSIEQPDPIKAQQTTARQLLDLGATQIEHDLKDAPEARLRALKMLADTYTELRVTERAVALNHERVALARSLYGADAAEVAYVLIDLSDNLQTSNAVPERAAVLREATRILDLHQENASSARGRLLRQLAQSSADDEPARALTYLDRAAALYRARQEPMELVRSLMARGFVEDRVGSLPAAVASLSEAAALCDGLKSICASDVPQLYSYLGDAQAESGVIPAAEAAYRRAFGSALARGGPDHADTIQTELRLGQMLFDTSRTSEGLQILRSALDRAIRVKGSEDGFHVPLVRVTYGYRLMQAGRVEEGVAEVGEAVSIYRKHRPTATSLAGWLDIEMYGLDSMGGYGEGGERLSEATALLAPLERTDARWRDHSRFEIERLISMGRAAETAHLVLKAGLHSTLEPGPLTRMKLREALLLAECARITGDVEKAAAIARRVREAIQADAARRYFEVYEAKASLIEAKALLSQRRASEALPLAQAAVTQLSSLYDRERSPELSDAQVTVANCDVELGRPEQALALLASAAAIQATHRKLGTQYTEPLRILRAKLATVARSRGERAR